MFPEHKWIPYRLEKLDLSHNNMPVITNDMLVGTKHLKYLNISYNILSDIRKGTNAQVLQEPICYHFFRCFEQYDVVGSLVNVWEQARGQNIFRGRS